MRNWLWAGSWITNLIIPLMDRPLTHLFLREAFYKKSRNGMGVKMGANPDGLDTRGRRQRIVGLKCKMITGNGGGRLCQTIKINYSFF